MVKFLNALTVLSIIKGFYSNSPNLLPALITYLIICVKAEIADINLRTAVRGEKGVQNFSF